jgi:hypothetical protein
LDREKGFQQALRDGAGPVMRGLLFFIERQRQAGNFDVGDNDEASLPDSPEQLRIAAWKEAEAADRPMFVESDLWLVAACLTVLFPALWVLWAFVARGGVSYRLMGMSLLRSDGRKAWRIQCAWRAFLVWAPVCALLSVALWLLLWYWSTWTPDTPYGWVDYLAWLFWAAALVLLPLYAALAFWSPDRALHDRLAGTYLVPR